MCRVPLQFRPHHVRLRLFLTNTYFLGIFFSILLVASDLEHFYVFICYMKLIKALNYRRKENVENSLFHLSVAKIS